MDKVANQLKKLIKINRKILNQLNKNDADISLLQQRFEERGNHTSKFTKLATEVDEATLTDTEKKSLQSLFERFSKQQQKIDEALDYIIGEAKERLDDAIKTTKAEQSYRVLNQ
jgi:hypothetical protein